MKYPLQFSHDVTKKGTGIAQDVLHAQTTHSISVFVDHDHFEKTLDMLRF